MRYSENMCPRYQHAIEILGKRWTGLILRVLLNGPARFNELAEQLQVVADRVLSERLKELEAEGIITRQVFAEVPVRVEYRLTEKGRDLAPVIEAIQTWSEQWFDAPGAAPDAKKESLALTSGQRRAVRTGRGRPAGRQRATVVEQPDPAGDLVECGIRGIG
ncbi:MAG: winged helix-turn-helix transcriptional regulator, partial [Ktedonobacterales bacterium]